MNQATRQLFKREVMDAVASTVRELGSSIRGAHVITRVNRPAPNVVEIVTRGEGGAPIYFNLNIVEKV